MLLQGALRVQTSLKRGMTNVDDKCAISRTFNAFFLLRQEFPSFWSFLQFPSLCSTQSSVNVRLKNFVICHRSLLDFYQWCASECFNGNSQIKEITINDRCDDICIYTYILFCILFDMLLNSRCIANCVVIWWYSIRNLRILIILIVISININKLVRNRQQIN